MSLCFKAHSGISTAQAFSPNRQICIVSKISEQMTVEQSEVRSPRAAASLWPRHGLAENIERGVQGQSWSGQSRACGVGVAEDLLLKAERSNPTFPSVDESSDIDGGVLALSSEAYSIPEKMVDHKFAMRMLTVRLMV